MSIGISMISYSCWLVVCDFAPMCQDYNQWAKMNSPVPTK